MKLFRKLFVLLLALTVAFAAVGCDSCNESEGPAAPSEPTAPNTSIYQPEAPIITMAAQKELIVGDDFYLAPKTKNVKGDLVWSSSNPAVATVVNGTVSALTKGTTTITASYEGVTATTEVTVGYGAYRPNVATYSGIDVEDSAKTAIPVGNDYFIGAYVDFNNKKFDDATFTYSSSNPEVLAIDANGVINPIKFGENVIITVNATWREEFTVSKSFSVDVRENVLFYSNNEILQNLVVNTPAVFIPVEERDNVIDLKPSVLAGPQATLDENVTVEVVPMEGTTAEEYTYDETNKVYSALALGKSLVKFSYTFEGSVYTSTFTIEAVRPVKELALPVELYSAGAGTYKVLDQETGLYANKTLVDYAWGEEAEVTLYDAYQDGEGLVVNGEIAENILVNFDTFTDTAVTLGTKTEQYTIYLNDACSYYISDANDVIGAFDKTDKTYSSIGYYVLLNDVDMTDAPAIKNNSQVKFQGTVEGQGYSIINPVIDVNSEAHKGFFGMMQSGSAVRNLAFININSIGHQPNVGWLTGEYSTIQKSITFENIFIDVNENMEHRGGMFVRIYGKLNNFIVYQNNGAEFDGKEWIKTASASYGNSLLARITSTIVDTNNLNNVYVISGGRVLQYSYTDGTSTHLSEPSYAEDYSIALNKDGAKIWNSQMTYGENETELKYVYDYFTNSTSIGGLGLKNPTIQSVIQAMGGNGKIAVAPNVRVYDSYNDMTVDTDEKHLTNLSEFTYSPYWVIVNGAPVWKGIYDNVELHDEYFGINVGNQSVKNKVAVKNYSDYTLTLNTFKSNLVTDLTFTAEANEYFEIKTEEIKNEEQVVIGTEYKLVTKNVSAGATVPVVASFKYNGVQNTKTIYVEVVNPFDVAINEVITEDGADIAIDGDYQFAISINGTAIENVTYASNDATVLALKAETTDTFTALKEGTATISATFTYNDKAEVRDFVVNVVDPIRLSSYVQIGTSKITNEVSLNAYNEFAVDVVLDSVAFDASKVAVTSSNTEVVTVEGNVIKLVKYVENATSTINVTLTEKGRTYNYSFVVKVANPFKLSVANMVADSHKLNLYSANALVVKVNDTVVENVTFETTATNASIADGVLTVNALGANATITATFNYGQNTGVVITVPVTFYDAVVDNSVITVNDVELEESSITLEIPSTVKIGVNYNSVAVEEVTLSGYDANAVSVTDTTITTVSNGTFDLTVTFVVAGKNHVIVKPVSSIYPSVTIDTPVEYDAATGKFISTATLEGDIFGASVAGQQLTIGNGLTVDENGITLRAQTSETDSVAGIPYISNKKGANQVFELTIQTNVNTYVFTNVTYWTQIIYDVTDLKEALGTSVDYTIVNLGAADTLTDREQTLNGKGFFVGTTKDGSNYYESVYNVGFYKMAANVDMEKASLGYVNNPLTTGNRIGGFVGYFDGNGYTIDNLTAGKEGIFGRVSTYVAGNEVNSGKSYRYYEYNPVIKNLAITNVITSYYNAETFLATPILATVIGTDTYAATSTTTTVSNIYATVNKTDSTALGSFVYHLAGHAKMNNVYVVNDVEFNMVEANSFKYRMTNDTARASAAIADGTKVWDITMNYTEINTGALFSWAYSNKGNAPTHGNNIATDTLDNTTNTYVVTTMPINFSTKNSLFAYPYNSGDWLDLKYSAENGIVFNRDNFYKLGKLSAKSKAYVAIGYAANEEVGNIIVPYTLKQSLVADAKALYANGGAIGSYGGTMFVCTTCGEVAIKDSPVTAPKANSACKSTADCTGKYVNLDSTDYKFVNPVNDKKGTGPMASPLAYEFTVHTAADMAEYFSDDCGAWKLKHVKRYDNVNAMKTANNDYTSFLENGNGLWKVVEGELIWVGAQA